MANLKRAYLPLALQPYKTDELVRLGAKADGGYVLDKKAIQSAKFLLSCGVNEDWTFEENFCALNDVPVVALDGSVGEEYFKTQVRSTFKKPWRFFWHWGVWRSYKRFYSGSKRHLQIYVGTDVLGGKKLSDIIRDEVPEQDRPYYLKMDIEGSEYGVLADVLATASELTGLIIEFHEVQKHLQKIVEFVDRLPLRLCHVHINNNGGVAEGDVPQVIECTFSRYCADQRSTEALPLSLDQTNWHKLPDFELVFS